MSKEQIIDELRSRWITKEELAEMLGTTERGARAYTEELTQRLAALGTCVLSTAARKGYHIGSFQTYQEAFDAYKKVREDLIRETAQRFYDSGKIAEDVYMALMKYQITDE